MEKLLRTIKHRAGKSEIYIVGGWLRDALLQRPNRDLDLAVAKNPAALARAVARALKGRFIILDAANGIYRVVLKNNPDLDYIDFARFKGRDITADLKNRDVTINSMALAVPDNGKPALAAILDPCRGKTDLKHRTIRVTSPKAFKDDPLRLLRVIRMAAELGFTIDPATFRMMKKESALISRSAAERVREELSRILSCDNAAHYLLLMDKAGLMEMIIPEIIQMKKSARRFYYHPSGLWQHSMETLMSLEEIYRKIDRFFPGHANAVRAHLDEQLSAGITRLSLLKLIALLHDVGKPSSACRIANRMRFLGHETKGADIASDIFARLRIGRKEIKIARRLIEHHMRPISLGQAKVTTPRAAFRLFRDLEENVPDLLLLSLADCYSYRRLKKKLTLNLKAQECTVANLVSLYFGEKAKPALPRLLDGHVLMQELCIEPGPVIGALLKEITEAQQLGKLNNRKEALALARKRLTLLQKKYKITVAPRHGR